MKLWCSKLTIILALLLFLNNAFSSWALEFLYKFNAGDKYRIVSVANEDIYVNRTLTYYAEIITRISVEVTAVNGEKGTQAATFQSAEKTVELRGRNRNAASSPFLWSKEYRSEFETDRLGYITISDQYYKPMVRDVPVFPGRYLNVGDTWSAEGIEVHDFRDNFGIEKPYRIPFTADYEYLGERVWKENSYPAFSVSYRVMLEPDAVQGRVYPRRIQEASDQVIFWDYDLGHAVAYKDSFRVIIDLSDGQTWEYRGTSEGEVVEALPMNKEEMAKEISGDIADIPDASVRVSDEGVVISIDDILFTANSTVLQNSEKHKLDLIADILMKYPDRDVLVGGHTAMAGTADGRAQISLDRAASVAEYLMDKNVRTPDRMVIRGYGADQPIADNRTAEGMAKNRRVEIVILEN